MSTDMKRAHKMAEAYDKDLLATDSRFSRAVKLVHEEGTLLFFESAFLLKWKDPEVKPGAWGACETAGQWLLVFTEHHGFHVYPLDDLSSWTMYEHVAPVEWLGEPPPGSED